MGNAARVGETKYSTPNDTDFVYERLFDAPRQIVFDAYTKPGHIAQWLLGPEGWTMPICEMDLRPGGAWRWGWRKDDGREMQMTGKILEIKAPELLVMTENWGPPWPETVNRVVFIAVGDQTLVRGTTTAPSKKARNAALGTGMTGGMDVSFSRLDELVRTIR